MERPTDLVTVTGSKAQLRMHPGQLRAWDSRKRFVCVLAGTQGGKTSWSPWWLWREIRERGEGDYLAVSATYDLFKLKMLPALLDVFVHTLGIGVYMASDKVIEIKSLKARIILRSADSEGGLESSTAKGAWLDEAGMDKFTIDKWEAVLRRLSIHQGRTLITTTIYNLGWLKNVLHDPWVKSEGRHPDIDVIQFDSTENPAFPPEEYERARASMPLWKFSMFYRGQYARPAGMIYDCFDKDTHVIPKFNLDPTWARFLGLDFGGINTAAVFLAQEPKPADWKPEKEGDEYPYRYFLYREYHEGNRTAKEHAQALKSGEPMIPTCVGGSKSEGQWRNEFRSAGLPIREPRISDVELGIQRGYSLIKEGRLFVFDTCPNVIDQFQAYSRKIDPMGEPTEDIQNKATWHLMDSYRYISTRLADTRRVGRTL